MQIQDIHVTEEVLDKIETKHRIEFYEVLEACVSARAHVRRGRHKLMEVFGVTDAGRYLLVILAHDGVDAFRLVTARDMVLTERRLYQRQTRGR